MSQELIIRIMADWSVFPIVLIATYSLIRDVPKGRRLQAYGRILMAGLTAYLLAKLIGSVYQPSSSRPFEVMGTTAGASFLNNPGFPSDHVLFVSAITCAVWFETKRLSIKVILGVLVAIVGLGRILALVHTPVDVIGGLVIAVLGSVWYLNSAQIRTTK